MISEYEPLIETAFIGDLAPIHRRHKVGKNSLSDLTGTAADVCVSQCQQGRL